MPQVFFFWEYGKLATFQIRVSLSFQLALRNMCMFLCVPQRSHMCNIFYCYNKRFSEDSQAMIFKALIVYAF